MLYHLSRPVTVDGHSMEEAVDSAECHLDTNFLISLYMWESKAAMEQRKS